MNERIEQCLYLSGLTAQGCWDELDDYAKQGIYKFAELIVREGVDLLPADMTHGPDSRPLLQVFKEHFGVAE